MENGETDSGKRKQKSGNLKKKKKVRKLKDLREMLCISVDVYMYQATSDSWQRWWKHTLSSSAAGCWNCFT